MEPKNLVNNFKKIMEKHFPDFFSKKNMTTWNDYISEVDDERQLMTALEKRFSDIFKIRIFLCWFSGYRNVFPPDLKLKSVACNIGLDFPMSRVEKSSEKLKTCFVDFILLLVNNNRAGSEKIAMIMHLLPPNQQDEIFKKFSPYNGSGGGIFSVPSYPFLYLINNTGVLIKFKNRAIKMFEEIIIKDMKEGGDRALNQFIVGVNAVFNDLNKNGQKFDCEFLMKLIQVVHRLHNISKKSTSPKNLLWYENVVNSMHLLIRLTTSKKGIDNCFEVYKTFCEPIESSGVEWYFNFIKEAHAFFLKNKAREYSSDLGAKIEKLIKIHEQKMKKDLEIQKKYERNKIISARKHKSAVEKMLV